MNFARKHENAHYRVLWFLEFKCEAGAICFLNKFNSENGESESEAIKKLLQGPQFRLPMRAAGMVTAKTLNQNQKRRYSELKYSSAGPKSSPAFK